MADDDRAGSRSRRDRRALVPLVIEVALLVAPLAAAACTGDDTPPPVDAAVDAEPDTPVI